ncbi:M24 family metallopeptidase [Mycolicibacterium baixiangningiae]|uniref:M24 family metallopeptidase n=1 Tax=Mycolicibacterium baixiangningiae TaxID=2761578 RepID=UPI0018D16B89|nr:Xaa-Pro peptidase family protein [Mycolicibacterium baixiangningiae]
MTGLLYDPARLAAALSDARLDAVVATTPAGVRYLTRFGKAGPSMAVVTRDAPDRPVLLVPAAELDYLVEDLVDGIEHRAWGHFVRFRDPRALLGPAEALVAEAHDARRPDLDRPGILADTLTALGLTSARIAFDVAPATEPALTDALDTTEVADASGLLPRLRMRKTDLELDRLREAARIAEAAIMSTTAIATTGVTQAELATEFRAAVAREGGLLRIDSVSIGPATVFGNANVPASVLTAGALLRFDVGAVYRGYQSDLSRCFSLGECEPKMKRYGEAVIAGQQAALNLLRPGVRAAEVFSAAVAETRRAGIPHYDRTHVGHGIGMIGGYDAPLLAPQDTHVIEEGMVLCVETPYYEFGFGGVQIEDMVVVTAAGWEPLSMLPRQFGTL